MTPLPLVSIGIPTYNRARLLPGALNTLLRQTYKNIEYIISDNASTDDTETLMRAYAAEDMRITYIRQPKNIGAIANHEFVLKQAKGKYFMWASDDDEWNERFVETLVRVLEENPDYGVAMSHYFERRLYPDGREETRVRTHNFTEWSRKQVCYYHLKYKKSCIFTFGLWRAALLKKLHTHLQAITRDGTRPMLAEAAFVAGFYSVQEPLHTRSQDMRSRIERHDPSHNLYSRQEFASSFSWTYYFITTFRRFSFSPVVPMLQRASFLLIWFRHLLRQRWLIIEEFQRFFSKIWPRLL